MPELLIFMTAIVIVGFAWRELVTTRDPLCPMVIFSPMLLYMFVYNPWTRVRGGGLASVFPDIEQLQIVFVAFFLGILAFSIGLCWGRVNRNIPDRRFILLPEGVSKPVRRQLFSLAVLMGLIANAAHWYMIWYSGGWSKVFSVAKPFLQTPSGYVGELPMLSYPALLMLAVAWQGRRLTLPRVMLFLLIATPQLTMATVGGRRGPMFLSVCALGACWCIVRSRRPPMKALVLGGGALALILLLLGENRSNLFTPWENEVDFTVVSDRLGPTGELTTGDEFVAGSAMIIASDRLDRHYWGIRYFTTFLVRPIPSAIWPSKYHDMGLGWMQEAPGSSGVADSEWISLVGFIPASGNAGGFIPDLFLEFSWGMLIGAFLIGRVYSACWTRWRTRGGVWILIYFELLILSVYLPSQSVGAWLYRLMLLVLPTWLIWHRIIAPKRRSTFHRRLSHASSTIQASRY